MKETASEFRNGVKAELKAVKWQSPKATAKQMLVVTAIALVIVALIVAADAGSLAIFGKLFD